MVLFATTRLMAIDMPQAWEHGLPDAFFHRNRMCSTAQLFEEGPHWVRRYLMNTGLANALSVLNFPHAPSEQACPARLAHVPDVPPPVPPTPTYIPPEVPPERPPGPDHPPIPPEQPPIQEPPPDPGRIIVMHG